MKTLKFIDGISKSEIKRLHGLDKNKNEIVTYLIGQLAKNDEFKGEITGKEILDYCRGVILKAYHVVGGRVALIECVDTPKLIGFYTNYGFIKLQNNENDLVQLRKLIC